MAFGYFEVFFKLYSKYNSKLSIKIKDKQSKEILESVSAEWSVP